MARNSLSAVVYDDLGDYTEAERYAAYGELQRQDETYFSSLYAKITNGGDNRQIFKGILDYSMTCLWWKNRPTPMASGTVSAAFTRNR